jgi:hypothetical protein
MEKMKIKLTLAALFIFQSFFLIAQTEPVSDDVPIMAPETDTECWTIDKTEEEMEALPWYGNNAYLDKLQDSVQQFLREETQSSFRDGDGQCNGSESALFIPVRFWFYQEEDNDPDMPTELQLQRMMDELNRLYQMNGMNVRFFAVCPQFVTDPDAVNMNNWQSFWNQFLGNNTDGWAINVHVVEDNESGNGVYNGVGDFIMVERNIYTGVSSGLTSTLAHEIGHYFGLDHTHRNHDKGKCRQEAVSRTRNFTAGQFFGCFPPKTGRICEKNGDGLCDTPADPRLSGKVNSSCQYTESEEDNWGDSYVPHTRNIMSYARKSCRDWFSNGQQSIMWGSMIFGRGSYLYVLDINETDPDKYEPDNSDMVGVPRLIEVGETQCHSFHNFSDCADEVDWLRVETSSGVVGKYVIEVSALDGINPVGDVTVWQTNALGERTVEADVTETNDGEVITIELACDEPVNDLLIEILKNDVEEGRYAVTLSAEPMPTMTNFDLDLVCTGESFTIENLPAGANVNWLHSSSISLSVSGNTATITGANASASGYWIQAVISMDGCSTSIFKSFEGANTEVPDFEIVELIPACYPPTAPLGRYTTVPATNVDWSINYGYVNPIGSMAIVEAGSVGWFTLTATASNSCGNEVTVSENFYADECEGGWEFAVSPNPARDILRVELSENFNTLDAATVRITNQFTNVKYEGTVSEKIFEVDLHTFENGMYYIHIIAGEEYEASTFIVNK